MNRFFCSILDLEPFGEVVAKSPQQLSLWTHSVKISNIFYSKINVKAPKVSLIWELVRIEWTNSFPSILRSIIFLVYINDLSEQIRSRVRFFAEWNCHVPRHQLLDRRAKCSSSRETSLSSTLNISLTVPRQYFFCGSFLLVMIHVDVCCVVVSVLCSLVVTCRERADLLAVMCVVFSCVLSLSQMCPCPARLAPWNWFKPSSNIFLLTVPSRYFFCGSFVLFMSCDFHAFAPVHCCLVVTCWERAYLLALVWDV